ncbi:MAG TPA: hypothetical protein VF615_16190 [Longimicrobiaceae bacterium]|jgi:hypothetical protein
MANPAPVPGRRIITREEALRRQKRLLTFGGVILATQVVYTAMIWVYFGRFPIWGAVAALGLWIFWVMLLRQYRRVQALPPTPAGTQGKRKRKRLRDPHRNPGTRLK